MNWQKCLRNLVGWVCVAAVCLLFYELFGLMSIIVGTFLAAFIVFDALSDRD